MKKIADAKIIGAMMKSSLPGPEEHYTLGYLALRIYVETLCPFHVGQRLNSSTSF